MDWIKKTLKNFFDWITGTVDAFFQWLDDIIQWAYDLLLDTLQAIWDMLTDLVCWIFDELLDLVLMAINQLDFSALQQYTGAWDSLPAEMINVLGLLGIGDAAVVIIAAIVIRLILQLIPFVRLGS